MAPFKEPQPRKNLIPNPEHIVDGQIHKPLPRKSDPQEAKPLSSVHTAEELLKAHGQTPIMAVPDYSPFQLRKAALEAACAIHQGARNQSGEVFWQNVGVLEAYLRDGTKPS